MDMWPYFFEKLVRHVFSFCRLPPPQVIMYIDCRIIYKREKKNSKIGFKNNYDKKLNWCELSRLCTCIFKNG